MKDKEFLKAINEIKKNRIVKHYVEPKILKHNVNNDSFKEIDDKEVLNLFNEVYKGNKEYTIEDIKKELVPVDVTYKK